MFGSAVVEKSARSDEFAHKTRNMLRYDNDLDERYRCGLLQVLQYMRVVVRLRIRWHDCRERTLAFLNVMRDTIRKDVDACHDGYKRSISCSLHTHG
jgi:hypothetical protein